MADVIHVNWHKCAGRVKPMHCVNNAPLSGTSEALWDTLKDAEIPYSRLHDTGGAYGGGRYVDIPNIFRNFSADPSDPASYDFAFTDWLLSKLHERGVRPFYRLGVTIENACRIKAYNIYPPADNEKFASVCEHIIMHYNEGWANGFNYGIEYWEIWNEPDNEEDPMSNPMWRGNKEQYYALYETVACRLKERFPHLKIGGYGSCGFYAVLGENVCADANVSARYEYFIDFLHGFLEHITAEGSKCPLDFFSWHSYSGADSNVKYAEYIRKTLDGYGFTRTESILNEWNPGIMHRGRQQDAVNIAEMMCVLHNAPVDMLMYYDAQISSSYCGLYDPVRKTPFRAYYVFYLFGKLYSLKDGAECTVSGKISAIAAFSHGKGGLFAVNATDKKREICFNAELFTRAYVYSVSGSRPANKCAEPRELQTAEKIRYTLSAGEIVYFELS